MRFLSRLRGPLTAGMLLGGLLWSASAAQALDLDKLRAAVPLPQMEAGFHFSFSTPPDGVPDGAPAGAPDPRPAALQIAELEAAPPADSAGWERLARLYLQNKNKNWPRAKSAWGIAATLLQVEVEAAPRDAGLMVRLGRAQNGAGQRQVAEATLRRATEIAPDAAKAWTALGDVQLERATHLILPTEGEFQSTFSAKTATFSGLSEAVLNERPSAKIIAQSKALLAEARASYARAVQVAPNDANLYLNLIAQRPAREFLTLTLRDLENGKNAPLKTAVRAGGAAYATLISPESAADFQVVARLKPRDASANGMAALASLVSFSLLNGREIPLRGNLESLPDSVAAPVREDIERLEVLAQGGAKEEAASLEALGVIAFVLGDPTAKAQLRRALSLDPARVQARELLVGLLARDEDFAALATLAQTQLAREDSARYHLLLAKADDKLGRATEVETQVDAALKLEPDDITANLARAALDLRAGDAARATESLARTGKLLTPEANPTAKQKSDYAVLQAALQALSGQAEAARTALQAILAADPKDESTQRVMDAVIG